MALAQPTPLPFPSAEGQPNPFQPQQQDLVVEFAEQFSALQGKFVYCVDEQELKTSFEKLCLQNEWTKFYSEEEKWNKVIQFGSHHHDIASCDISVTGCESLIARTGSIVLSSEGQGRIPSVYAPVHVCIAYTSQLVYDLKDGLQSVKQKYGEQFPSFLTFATGPSRTADIEKTLVVGVHGPKEVYCFVVDDQT